MEWITDIETPYSRLMIGIARHGVTIRDWNDDVEPWEDGNFHYRTATYSWCDIFKAMKHDCVGGRLKERIGRAASYLLCDEGTSSTDCGPVPSLYHAYDCGHVYHV